MSVSVAPVADVVREAKSTRFTVSLLMIAAIAGGCYWAGRQAAGDVSEVKATLQDQRLEQIVKALEAQAELAKAAHAEDVHAHEQIKDRLHVIGGEVQVVKSHVSQGRR